MNVNIEGLDKAEVLAALFNASKQQGMGFMHTNGLAQMSTEDARELLKQSTYFDYLRGRVMKIEIEDNINPRNYDRDNGEGAVEQVIEALRVKVRTE